MKGSLFTALNDMIVNQQGMPFWNSIIDEVNPHSGGIYRSTEYYQDRELADLLIAVSQKRHVTVNDVQHDFGHYLFNRYKMNKPKFDEDSPDLFSFLASMECIVQQETKKLSLDPNLTSINCEKISDSKLRLLYKSPHRLCFMTEGLILGAAQHYKETVSISHDKCMHLGHDQCQFNIVSS